jgi:catechol 2,3-dioxygenase-like lactoylglutathione lyase family enzyme
VSIHHVTLWVTDLDGAAPAWAWLLIELGYVPDDPGPRLVFRHPDGLAVVLEESTDMVPGALYSRMRPGLNHLAFRVPSGRDVGELVAAAVKHGWTALPTEGHPIAGGAAVAFLEGPSGFEVELVAPS